MNNSQNKLGEMPVGKLIITMSVPMMISMFIQALYNVVDSIFVAKICEDALTAVSLAYPLQSVMNAVAVGTGVGVNALVSRSLGEGNFRRAEKAANVQIFLGLVYAFCMLLVGLFFARKFYTVQTDVQSIIDYGEQYLSVVCCWSLGLFFSQGFEKLLVATGNSTPSMISQALGAILNIILDPIFIFTFGLGVRGAAIATVIGQCSAALCAYLLNLKYNQATHFDLRQLLPDRKILRFIYAVGLPSTITIGLNAIMSYAMNGILLTFSTTAAAVYGVWMKLLSFGCMPVFGMNNGTIAIFSYNHGAKKYDRVFATLRIAMTLGVCITLAVTSLYELIPGPLMRLFNASDYMMSIGVPAVRICGLSLTLGAACVIISSASQSLGHAGFALFINLCRQIIILLPVAFLLASFRRLELVWFAPMIAEALSLVVAIFICRRVIRELKQQQAASAR